MDELEKYKREMLKAYKNIFSGTIKESFLVRIHDKVEKDPCYCRLFASTIRPDVFAMESILSGKNYSTISICKMIVMTHYSNTFLLSEEERGKKQNDSNYINYLVDQIVKMYSIEQLATPDFSNSSLEVFLPLIYYVSAVTNACGDLFDNFSNGKIKINNQYNEKINHIMLYKIIMKIKACIQLADIRATDELIAVFRTLIEQFMLYSVLWDQNDEVIGSFLQFNQFTFDYSRTSKAPDELKVKARKNKCNIVDYLNYGWLETMASFNELNSSEKAFKLKTIGLLMDSKFNCVGFGTGLYKIYKSCNPQTHFTSLFMNYFELEMSIFQNISAMLMTITDIVSKNLFDIKFEFNGLDLVNELRNINVESKKASLALSQNNDLLNKTNQDYRNRVICSAKMKK